MEDGGIIDLYWARLEKAIEETAAKYGAYCRSIAMNILGNAEDAEESVNDTYLHAWNSMPPHRPAVLSTFLGKITRRVAIDRWRKQTAQKRGGGEMELVLEELSDCVPAGQNIEQEMEAAELAKSINSFVQVLPEVERRIFICRYWYFDQVTDISGQTGFSQSKVKMILHRVRKKLLAYLEREDLL